MCCLLGDLWGPQNASDDPGFLNQDAIHLIDTSEHRPGVLGMQESVQPMEDDLPCINQNADFGSA